MNKKTDIQTHDRINTFNEFINNRNFKTMRYKQFLLLFFGEKEKKNNNTFLFHRRSSPTTVGFFFIITKYPMELRI